MHSKNKPFTNINEIIDNTIEGILIIKDGFIEHVNKSLMDILCYEDEKEFMTNICRILLYAIYKIILFDL